MSGPNFPIVRLEVDRIAHGICVALNHALDTEKQNINELVRKTVEDFDFAAVVSHETNRQLGTAMEEAISETVRLAFRDRGVQEALLSYTTTYITDLLEVFKRAQKKERERRTT